MPKQAWIPAQLDAPSQKLLYWGLRCFWGASVWWKIDILKSQAAVFLLENWVNQYQLEY